MNQQQLSQVINTAKTICKRSGGRLTEKRQSILELLLVSETPLSAYEVTDAFNKTAEKSMPPMSVYRILDFLEKEDLVHKLSSTNKYVACSHIDCSHAHGIPQFLICDICQSTKEVVITQNILEELSELVNKAGYTLSNSKFELQCICDSCSAKSA